MSAEFLGWWNPHDGDITSRTMRFVDGKGIWLPGDELPDALDTAGCFITKVAGVTHHAGIASASITVGGRVMLRPEPGNP